MQLTSTARRLSRVSKSLIFLCSDRFLAPQLGAIDEPAHQWRRNSSSVSSHSIWFSGTGTGNCWAVTQPSMHSMMSKATFSSEAVSDEGSPSEAVKELYDKILQSVVNRRTMSPNAWLWSLIENCNNHEDIKLLFNVLEGLRIFRLTNLRIHDNFNPHLCQEITRACVRVGAIKFGKKTLWKHNVYGLSPSTQSVNHLLSYAKQHNDVKLMEETMKLVKKNDIPLQSSTADIVFSICYNADNWKLMSKYSKRFVGARVKLRQTSFDTWMEFAAKIGDVESLWKAEKLRSVSMKYQRLESGLSCAKGFLLESKPQDAAAIIQGLHQNLSDKIRPRISVELQKLVNEWPLEVIKRQPGFKKKALATSLKSDIPAMLAHINMDLEVNLEHLEDPSLA